MIVCVLLAVILRIFPIPFILLIMWWNEKQQPDYEMARKYLERIDWDCKNGFYLLGYLYARGLGGPKDIARGVELLRKAGDTPQAKAELKRYEKTLFGKRVER